LVAVADGHRGDLAKCFCIKAVILSQLHVGPHPEFCFRPSLEDVDMRWCPGVALIGIEEKTESFQGVALSRVLHEHAGISPDLAVRLERAGISTARHWMALQSAYELWQAELREQSTVQPLGMAG